MVAFRHPAYEAKIRVRERKHPKLYWIDPGLVRAVSGKYGELHPEERGALLEGLIATVLRAYRDHRGTFTQLYYWATASSPRVEVDFLLQRGRDLCAIEVKSGTSLDNRHLKGLRAVGEFQGVIRRILIYRGRRPMRTEDGIEILPVEEFLAVLDADGLF